jgi:hypothetical protein
MASPRARSVAVFLAIAAASMVSMQVVWKAQLGVREDWNLYAIGGIAGHVRDLAGLGQRLPSRCRCVSSVPASPRVACFHTYAWILSNHRYQ